MHLPPAWYPSLVPSSTVLTTPLTHISLSFLALSGDFSANFGGSELLPGPDELVSIWDKQGAAKIREMKAAQGKGGGAGEPLSAQEKAELETVFRSHDQDGNGVLDKEELSKCAPLSSLSLSRRSSLSSLFSLLSSLFALRSSLFSLPSPSSLSLPPFLISRPLHHPSYLTLARSVWRV
eukprot:3941056-Rhodomonas_salina.3